MINRLNIPAGIVLFLGSAIPVLALAESPPPPPVASEQVAVPVAPPPPPPRAVPGGITPHVWQHALAAWQDVKAEGKTSRSLVTVIDYSRPATEKRLWVVDLATDSVVAERVGIIRTVVLTEAATSVAIIAILAAPLPVAMLLLVPLGVALNGTSSVLYATVADLVTAERRSRAYGLYYTLTIAASAVGPTVYGVVGDAVGAAATLSLIAVVVLTTIPLCLLLRAAVAAPARG